MKTFNYFQVALLILCDILLLLTGLSNGDWSAVFLTNMVFGPVQGLAALVLMFSGLPHKLLLCFYLGIAGCLLLLIYLNMSHYYEEDNVMELMYACWGVAHYFAYVCYRMAQPVKTEKTD